MVLDHEFGLVQDSFDHEGCAFDIDCYEMVVKDYENEVESTVRHIEHQLVLGENPNERRCLRIGDTQSTK